jgi:hypothetical protein
MILQGTMYLIDEQHIDVLKNNLMTMPPPMGGRIYGSVLCLDMDETSDDIEQMFPMHTQKATLLTPPPIAMQYYVDGNAEGFIEQYNYYLDFEESVQEFICSMLFYMHMGGNILLYCPQCLDDDSIWLNTLQVFFYTRYGITTGTSAEHRYQFDMNYNDAVNNLLYSKGFISIIEYINETSNLAGPGQPGSLIWNKAMIDLPRIGGYDVNPIDTYLYIKHRGLSGRPFSVPGLSFG